MYFTQQITGRAHALRLPHDEREDIARLVLQHQGAKASREMVPFRRQVDYWVLCVTAALALGLDPLDQASTIWGYKFVDTREVRLADWTYDMLAVVAFSLLGAEHEDIADPASIVEVANRLAGAASPVVMAALTSKDLRLNPLEKTLSFVSGLLSEPHQPLKEDE